MAEEFDSDLSLTPKELAEHLRKPKGETGVNVGLQMNKGNKHICLNSYSVLNPKAGDVVLEIGMGNGFFIKDLMGKADNIRYTGVDFSKIMVQEASDINNEFLKQGKVQFFEASIENLPFESNSFDCITTTNTLYFWPQPEQNIKELLRVLKPNGKLLVAYRSKKFMDKIELSNYGFEKYERLGVENLFKNGGFNKVNTQIINEPELSFDGISYIMQGLYTTGVKI